MKILTDSQPHGAVRLKMEKKEAEIPNKISTYSFYIYVTSRSTNNFQLLNHNREAWQARDAVETEEEYNVTEEWKKR